MEKFKTVKEYIHDHCERSGEALEHGILMDFSQEDVDNILNLLKKEMKKEELKAKQKE
jgi:hypothetical protein